MSDTSRHLTYFKVENFKRFESFEMKDLGQFNLIVGDNNVGKTSVLEALLVDDSNGVACISNFARALSNHNFIGNPTFRELSYFKNQENDNPIIKFILNTPKEQREIHFLFDLPNHRFKILGILDTTIDYFYNDSLFSSVDFKIPLIPFDRSHQSDLVNYYATSIQTQPKQKNRIFDSLKILIPDIQYIEPSKLSDSSFLIVTQGSRNSTLPLALYGDGTVKLFRFLLEILVNKGKRLMIDEVDAGIHYSRFKEFWKVILTAAKENDVQLFMTTHSKECMQYFVEALSEPGMADMQRDARSIALVELPDKSIKSYSYPFEHLEANLALGSEVR
jgi:AAA15 family ATPase/GTPase